MIALKTGLRVEGVEFDEQVREEVLTKAEYCRRFPSLLPLSPHLCCAGFFIQKYLDDLCGLLAKRFPKIPSLDSGEPIINSPLFFVWRLELRFSSDPTRIIH